MDVVPVHEADAGTVIQGGIAEARPERLAGEGWLVPDFADRSGRMLAVTQAFVVRVGGLTILVDTCVGNHKARPGLPAWSGMATDFLQRLSLAGVEPDDVDVVVCTHLHFDHVGWNTVPVDGAWVPLFRNARHLICRAEFEHWSRFPDRESADDLAGIRDSITPVVEAGLVDLVAADHVIHPDVRFLASHGHTPGHVSVLIESAGERALISGDAIHHPCQIVHTAWGIFSDFDPEQAHATRRDLLGYCADSGALLIGTHFPPPTAVTVKREGSGFAIG